jgi:hypothetical protein
MQNLRCKIGDLAIVVRAKLPENLGQIVEVLGPQTDIPFRLTDSGHVWQVRAAGGRASLYYRFEKSGRVVRHAEGPVPDSCLDPISGVDLRTDSECAVVDAMRQVEPAPVGTSA